MTSFVDIGEFVLRFLIWMTYMSVELYIKSTENLFETVSTAGGVFILILVSKTI